MKQDSYCFVFSFIIVPRSLGTIILFIGGAVRELMGRDAFKTDPHAVLSIFDDLLLVFEI